ncbi:hypothetical protein SUGI_0919030 [Cryptomeria japonica]|uniref:rho GDP-dissociation inhibitor 1 n=1 Tax=Cryptomeria japonica TaxID=3369 RepID=UPI002414BD69|nr:rho GDP-dissociation inhibitor 1 [Cryptomeria japonica]GLJ44064.1 hypothetical protein SUGI_0919030 [Cryptomeria japonica]
MEGVGIEQRAELVKEGEGGRGGVLERQLSSLSLSDSTRETAGTEQEDGSSEENDESADTVGELFVPGPMCSLKDHWERDKEDESIQRWKKQLLGFADFELNDDKIEPDVTVLSLGIVSKGYPEITLQLPLDKKSNDVCFILKEGSNYHLKFTFMVHHNIVCGLSYTNTVWRGGIRVDQTQGMLGTFSPRREPYVNITEEDTTPKGILARGTYTAKTKFMDDDGKCYLEVQYSFEIQKDWKDKKSESFHKVHKKQWLSRSLSHQLNLSYQFSGKQRKQENQQIVDK